MGGSKEGVRKDRKNTEMNEGERKKERRQGDERVNCVKLFIGMKTSLLPVAHKEIDRNTKTLTSTHP